MEKIGLHPYWKSETIGDKMLVAFFTALYWISHLPMHFLTRVLGRTRANWFLLDLLTLPGKLCYWFSLPFGRKARQWGRKANALGHTFYTCRLCPESRQATRDPARKGRCAWNMNWNEGNFRIPADFGARNYFRHFFGKEDLKDFHHLLQIK